jgi:hypothetical protein
MAADDPKHLGSKSADGRIAMRALTDAQALVRKAVERYCQRYCISPPFEISALYDVETDYCTKSWPFNTDSGCYVFYGENGRLVYVGLGLPLGRRLAAWFKGDAGRGVPKHRVVGPGVEGGWQYAPRFIQAIRVHEAFEAPSLEAYLIRELQPSDNTRRFA